MKARASGWRDATGKFERKPINHQIRDSGGTFLKNLGGIDT